MPDVDLIEHADGRRYLRTGACDGCADRDPAACCQYLMLPLARALSPDEQRWVGLHPGVSIVGQSVRIDIPCGALEDGRCSLYGTPQRPALCVRYPEQPSQVIAGCAYQLIVLAG